MKPLFTIIILITISGHLTFSQSSFVYVKDDKFYLGKSEFYFLGFSAYYLQLVSSDSSRKHITDDVFRIAKETGIKVVRTWTFNSRPDSDSQSIIRYSPYGLKEEGLSALDYVVFKAGQYNIKLVLTLENNFNDFGGIEQYVKWGNTFLSPGNGKQYRHNDFFTDDSLKSWYKFYMRSILNRTNVYTGIKYKDEPVIFSFELINEASNTGYPVTQVNNWYKEMSGYFKSIDKNHLLTTGEIGYDTYVKDYSDPVFYYSGSYFLFNGSKGTSFVDNTSLKDIDYSSFHLYPEAWGFEPLGGNTWINDHISISDIFNKPALLGEFGVVGEKVKNYKIYFETIRNTPSKSAIIWDYVHQDLMNIADKYAFNEVQNPELFSLFKEHINLLNQDSVITGNKDFVLYQNYPNPFNPSTTIKYSLKQTEYVKVELFNSLGERIGILDKGVRIAGTHSLFLSFDNGLLASGIYFYRITAEPGNLSEIRKMILLK